MTTIGPRKYEALKSFNLDLDNMTEEKLKSFQNQFPNLTVAKALKQMEAFEKSNIVMTPEDIGRVNDRLKKLQEPEEPKQSKELTKELLWELFYDSYLKVEGVKFIKNPDTIENIKPLFYYFIGDLENFKKCQNVSGLSIPSLKKGLLIIGGYGNGKTSIMKTLEYCFKKSNIKFSFFSANQVVDIYETYQREEFNKLMFNGTAYFDDVLTERDASNYGKANLFKEILERRYSRNLRTYISCNYPEDQLNDLDAGLKQFGTRYGGRVYDRLFSMFNIIEFQGKTFRR